MTWIRRLALPGLLAVLCLGAAPAHATLLVRSDGAGLLIQDKNGISDDADMFSIASGGTTAWNIRNKNDFDVFKFDFQTGCERASSFEAECKRFGPVISVVLVGGDDRFSIVSASPSAQASVKAGSGDDEVSGHGGHDDLNGGTGDDELAGAGGTDSVDGRDGADRLEGGPGNDEVDGDTGADVLIGGPGFDELRGDENNDALFAREPATAGSSLEDTVACGSGTDFAELDLKDVFTSCEQRDIAPVGEPPTARLPVRNLRVARAGRVRARLRCPRGVHDLGC